MHRNEMANGYLPFTYSNSKVDLPSDLKNAKSGGTYTSFSLPTSNMKQKQILNRLIST